MAACIHPLIAYGEFRERYLSLLRSSSTVAQATAALDAHAGPTAAAIVGQVLADRRRILRRSELARLRAVATVGGFKRGNLTVGQLARFIAFELAERQPGPRVHLGVRRETDIDLITRYHTRAGRSVAVISKADLLGGRGLRCLVAARAKGRALVMWSG